MSNAELKKQGAVNNSNTASTKWQDNKLRKMVENDDFIQFKDSISDEFALFLINAFDMIQTTK